MTLQRPMFPPPLAADRARHQCSTPEHSSDLAPIGAKSSPSSIEEASPDHRANLPDGGTPPKPQKRLAKRRNARRRKGTYYPANITLDDFFKAYHTLPVVSSKPSREGLSGPERSFVDDRSTVPTENSLNVPAENISEQGPVPRTLLRKTSGREVFSDSGPRQTPFPALEALARLRDEAAAEVDRLIAFLDATEADGDLEPSMGRQNAPDECEPDDGEDEDGGDDEPSLGFLQRNPSLPVMWGGGGHYRDYSGAQTDHCEGLADDREDEHDGGEPDVDDEPSLAAIEAIDQEYAWCFTTSGVDCEADPADSGIADIDGLIEQCGPRRVARRGVQFAA